MFYLLFLDFTEHLLDVDEVYVGVGLISLNAELAVRILEFLMDLNLSGLVSENDPKFTDSLFLFYFLPLGVPEKGVLANHFVLCPSVVRVNVRFDLGSIALSPRW